MSEVWIDIDMAALVAAAKRFGTKTKNETVNRALREAAAQDRQEEGVAEYGRM
jgi:Arc/MetJ family transcription regulator